MNPLELISAELRAAIEELIDERIAAALEAQPADGSPWLTLAEAARYVYVSPRTLARMLERGRLRSTYIGSRRLVNRAELDAYLEAQAGVKKRRPGGT